MFCVWVCVGEGGGGGGGLIIHFLAVSVLYTPSIKIYWECNIM